MLVAHLSWFRSCWFKMHLPWHILGKSSLGVQGPCYFTEQSFWQFTNQSTFLAQERTKVWYCIMLHHVPFYGIPISDFFRLPEQHQAVRMVDGHRVFVTEPEISRNYITLLSSMSINERYMTHRLTDTLLQFSFMNYILGNLHSSLFEIPTQSEPHGSAKICQYLITLLVYMIVWVGSVGGGFMLTWMKRNPHTILARTVCFSCLIWPMLPWFREEKNPKTK